MRRVARDMQDTLLFGKVRGWIEIADEALVLGRPQQRAEPALQGLRFPESVGVLPDVGAKVCQRLALRLSLGLRRVQCRGGRQKYTQTEEEAQKVRYESSVHNGQQCTNCSLRFLA